MRIGAGVVIDDQLAQIAEAFRHGLKYGLVGLEFGLLRHKGHMRRLRDPDIAVVQRVDAGNGLEQGGFALAIAPDQTDAFASSADNMAWSSRGQ